MTRRTRTAMHICDYIGARMTDGAVAVPAEVVRHMRVAVSRFINMTGLAVAGCRRAACNAD